MVESNKPDSPFRLLDHRRSRPILGPLAGLAERVLGLSRLDRVCRDIGDAPDARSYLARGLEAFRITAQTVPGDRERIPTEGACVVVANHPFGIIEGILILDHLLRIRPDVKVLANHVLARFTHLKDHLIHVDPFGGRNATANNITPVREAIEWVAKGGMLVVFPAGEVAHRRWGERGVRESEWPPTVARILSKTKAVTVPMFFDGHNGALFHLAGLIHPALRTLMLPRAALHNIGRTVPMRVGKPIPFDRLERLPSKREMVDYIRLRTLILGRRVANEKRGLGAGRLARFRTREAPIVPPVAPARLAADLAALPPENRLVEAKGFEVWIGEAELLPNVLREIGRLREETFREVGEGTGRSIDLDHHDEDYLHLFVWRPEDRCIVSAYRLGRVDELLARGGPSALYTTSLFRYEPPFLDHISDALEVGRSFVCKEYQRSYMPLMLMWKGIGAFTSKQPRYRKLFGPVSISATYGRVSRELILEHLRLYQFLPEFANHVSPRHPVRGGVVERFGLRWTPSMLDDLGDVSTLVAEMEADQKGVPVLIRGYLKLGGKLVGFNLDSSFHGVIDGLVVVDLVETPMRILERYMGKDGARSFKQFHDAAACPP